MSADARRLPFPDASFDVIIACNVLEHIEEDVSAMRGLRRVVGPGPSALTTAVTLANTCASAYVRANEKTRRLFNNAVFEAVLVRDRKAAEARICDPCDLLFSSRRFEYGDLAGRSRHY
jgi:ubiquinone/menaquinone biosynthesis C-methylase UbiE